MKVLLTNHTLASLGGSETFTYALAKELHSRDNIDLHVYSRALGIISNKLKQEGISVGNSLGTDKYDVVLTSQASVVPYIDKIKGIKIQTCHGIYVPEERPDSRVDKYVSITEEVRDSLLKKNIQSTIITNGVDCERFNIKSPINKKVKSLLSLSQSADLNKMIARVCDKMGIKFTTLNKFVNPVFNVEDIINENDVVISLGRGVYESMACGRNVIILDKRPYIVGPAIGDGIINKDNINNYIKNNCSGRYSRRTFTENDLIKEILKYEPEYGEHNREYAVNNLNIIKKVDEYLKLI